MNEAMESGSEAVLAECLAELHSDHETVLIREAVDAAVRSGPLGLTFTANNLINPVR
jgi:hypothetical protein